MPWVVQCLPMTWESDEVLHIVFIGLNVMMWISLYCSATIDPGFIPINMPEYDQCLKQVRGTVERDACATPRGRSCS